MIHYHGTPISGGTQAQMALQNRHIMISFATARQAEMLIELCSTFTVDNGAFSVWKSGKEFDLDGYAQFVERWHRHPAFDWCVMPDVIDGDEHDNALMRARWFSAVDQTVWRRSIPVWHMHEPIDVLRDLVNAFDRIALGSSGQFAIIGAPEWWTRMYEAMEVICDEERRPKVRVHGLRMLDPSIFSVLPLASADSTNVARNAGIDKRWIGPYAPVTPASRAAVLIERIEAHASASTLPEYSGHRNFELFG
ncbi:MAG: hypothetical protein MKZ95_12005 [Pirellulales bacterium]|nr:hypothetical protein [Pirellulales bacterium]